MHFCLIDLQRDYFEEISNDDETHRLTGNNGCASEKLYQLCDATVVPEYRDLVRRFLDVPTLAERLKNEEYISTEYRMCDGSWHSLRFVAKIRDEAGNVTHVSSGALTHSAPILDLTMKHLRPLTAEEA